MDKWNKIFGELHYIYLFKVTQTHPFSTSFLTELRESSHHYELHDAGEDEDHAGQHPDVKV